MSQNNLQNQEQFQKNPFIKLHLKNGGIYILNEWEADSILVSGSGVLLNASRDTVKKGHFEVPIGDFVIAESNRIDTVNRSSALFILTGVSLAVNVFCFTNPKVCYGSCPTFYATDGNEMILQAEEFSSSVLPSMESIDIDALYLAKPKSRYLEIIVKNQALETHVIRKANILALKKSSQGRVLTSSEGKFFKTTHFSEPTYAIGQEGDISEKLLLLDGNERFSLADDNDLAKKEFIQLSFRNSFKGKIGLVLAFRQTLLTTFLFYQTLVYMGNLAGDYFAEIERNKNVYHSKLKSPGELLGGIEVFAQDKKGNWIFCGEFKETGPIAINLELLPLPNQAENENVNIRLVMAKGMWWIDYVSLVKIGGEVFPLRITPENSIPAQIANQNIVASLNDETKTIVTLPGEQFYLFYKLPVDYSNYDLFIETQGYFLEWIRDVWLPEENQEKVSQLFIDPKQYLRDLTPGFKKIEGEMEKFFWNSKYVNP